MSGALRGEIETFLADKEARTAEARQLVALQLVCGIDLMAATSSPASTCRVLARLERALERERLKGLRGHWSYDLNRHIALKQALDRLRPPAARSARRVRFAAKGETTGPARQRRRPKAPPQQ